MEMMQSGSLLELANLIVETENVVYFPWSFTALLESFMGELFGLYDDLFSTFYNQLPLILNLVLHDCI